MHWRSCEKIGFGRIRAWPIWYPNSGQPAIRPQILTQVSLLRNSLYQLVQACFSPFPSIPKQFTLSTGLIISSLHEPSQRYCNSQTHHGILQMMTQIRFLMKLQAIGTPNLLLIFFSDTAESTWWYPLRHTTEKTPRHVGVDKNQVSMCVQIDLSHPWRKRLTKPAKTQEQYLQRRDIKFRYSIPYRRRYTLVR